MKAHRLQRSAAKRVSRSRLTLLGRSMAVYCRMRCAGPSNSRTRTHGGSKSWPTDTGSSYVAGCPAAKALKPERARELVRGMCADWAVSIRRACGAMRFACASYHYKSRRTDPATETADPGDLRDACALMAIAAFTPSLTGKAGMLAPRWSTIFIER